MLSGQGPTGCGARKMKYRPKNAIWRQANLYTATGEYTLGLKEICIRTAIKILLIPLLAAALLAQRPWRQITVPSVPEAAANFKTPPHEYGVIQPGLGPVILVAR